MNGEDISGVGTLTATDVTVSGTVDAGAVNTRDLNIKGSNATPRVDNAVVAPGLSDPVYHASDYADIWAALDQALTDMSGSLANEVYLPPGDYTINSGKVTIPDFGVQTAAPKMIGPGYGRCLFTAGSSFPDSVLIDSEPASSNRNKGLYIGGLHLDNTGTVTDTLVNIVDRPNATIENLRFVNDAATIGVKIADSTGGDDFVYLRDLYGTGIASGQTGVLTTGNFVMLEDSRFAAGVNGTGTAVELQGGQNFINADFNPFDIGIDVSNGGTTHIFSRFEAPSSFGTTPIKIRGGSGHTIKPMNVPASVRRHSEIAAANVNWDVGQLMMRQNLEFGATIQSIFNTVGDLTAVSGWNIEVGDSTGDSRLDLGGNGTTPSNSDITEDMAPTMHAFVNPSTGGSALTRVGLVNSRWSDWAGAFYDPSVGEWDLRAVEGGTVTSSSTGLPGQIRVSVSLGPNGYVGVGIRQANVTNDDTAHAEFTLSSQFAGVEPTLAVENTSGNSRISKVAEFRVEATDWGGN
jgi:hypothetical protein